MAFQTALSGLNAANSNLSVTGNNIANSSTTGFKSSTAQFGDVYAVSFGGVSNTATGSGVRLEDVKQNFTQGNVDFTNNNLDLAISGDGFFVLNNNGQFVYSRAGSFNVDRDGYVVNPLGQRLQMYTVDPTTGAVSNFTPQDLQLNLGSNPANATTAASINLNLDATATVPTAAFNPAVPASYNFSTTTTVYDSLGVTHQGSLYFVKTAANAWTSYLYLDGNATGSTNVTFNPDGSLAGPVGATNMTGAGWNPGNGSAVMNVTVDFTGTTQYGATSAVNALTQDGYTTGRLAGVSVDNAGIVYARYTNGQSQSLGAVAMGRFNNPNGLQQVGDTNWAQTFESGDLLAGQAGSGTFGQIQSGALEASNVDVAKQLVNMIIAQRDFQANAKMITTEDQVTQTIINIR